eukprot:m.150759 g.150759  ORF g.150759 m.150759 type:complete len:110 (+) comp30741_c2_seq6:94-423(+)
MWLLEALLDGWCTVDMFLYNSPALDNAIQNAVEAFTAVRIQTPTVTSSSCKGTQCMPSIDSSNSEAIGIRAPSGEIQLESKKCGQFDPCETNINAMAIQAAMEELKFAQ